MMEDVDMMRLKRSWREMGIALGEMQSRVNPGQLRNMQTTLDKLRTRYLRIGTLGSVFVVLYFPFLMHARFIEPDLRMPVAVTFALFVLAMSFVDFWFRNRLGKINPVTMSVSEVARLSLHYKKCHLRCVMVGIPTASCWIGFFAYATISTYNEVLWGMLFGVVLGGILGCCMLRKFLADYKQLKM